MNKFNTTILDTVDIEQWHPDYSFMFPFEKNFQPDSVKDWMTNNWHYSFYAVTLYLVVIFGGRQLMSNRPAFRLKKLLTLWNISLALFSITGTLRTMPELLHVLKDFGFHHSVCADSFFRYVKPSGFWTWMFILSKVPELGDTVFIVLRKQNLMFLHWYHHITVLVFTWFAVKEITSPARWFVNVNYFVHSLMYSYYALKALGFHIPKRMAMIITTSQIVQMVIGAYVIAYAYYSRVQGHTCSMTDKTAFFGLIMYGSYFYLFARFFYLAYIHKSGKKSLNHSDSEESIRQELNNSCSEKIKQN